MIPRTYVDIQVRNSNLHNGGPSSAILAMSRLMQVLHGILRTYPERFALAFPRMKMGEARHPGNLIRVFAETQSELALLTEELEASERLRPTIIIKKPCEVPAAYAGPWKEYRRIRVPGNRSRLEKCREYRLNKVEQLPHFRTSSKMTGQPFVLFVEERSGAEPAECMPDSYGLSVPSRAFALPALP